MRRLAPFTRTLPGSTFSFSSVPEQPAAKPVEEESKPAKPSTPSPKPTLMDKAVTLAPGTLASVAVMTGGFFAAEKLGKALLASQGLHEGASPISGVPVAILLGLALNNTISLPKSLKPGLKFCTTTVLRAGIVCVGIKLSMYDVVKLGTFGVPVVMSAVGSGLLFVTWFNKKMGLPPRLGLLTAAGTSICGVTAVMSLAPAIKATEQEVAYAVANVVAFGTLGMLVYPYLAPHLLSQSEQIGLFLGTAIHDTSQVMGAALTYKEVFGDEVVLKVAAVTKLTRNLFLAAVIPGLTYLHHRAGGAGGQALAGGAKLPFSTLFPSFIGGFILMAAIRTLGDITLADGLALGVLEAEQWKQLTSFVGGGLTPYLLGTAMSAVGLGTNFEVFRGVGLKPFAVGMTGALVVAGTGFVAAFFLGPYISIS